MTIEICYKKYAERQVDPRYYSWRLVFLAVQVKTKPIGNEKINFFSRKIKKHSCFYLNLCS